MDLPLLRCRHGACWEIAINVSSGEYSGIFGSPFSACNRWRRSWIQDRVGTSVGWRPSFLPENVTERNWETAALVSHWKTLTLMFRLGIFFMNIS
ncbi:hypothetical protein RRG08_021250 [Elysia crispata]|uniref:Uncharacterized protein n=1 Tax=Elysia crispata TaxID=231223 RepID=A0AAE0YXX3_9GAST|nr:hypothetical protein RRG08_021250 [Elysia crispata]